MADGDDPLSGLEIGGLAHLEVRVFGVFAGVDFQHAAVDALVLAVGLAVESLGVGEDDPGFLAGGAGDVSGGEDGAVFLDNDAAALATADLHADDRGHHLVENFLHVLFNVAQLLDGGGGPVLLWQRLCARELVWGRDAGAG